MCFHVNLQPRLSFANVKGGNTWVPGESTPESAGKKTPPLEATLTTRPKHHTCLALGL